MIDNTSIVGQHISFPNFFASLLVYLFVSIAVSFWRAPRYPTSIPWVGHGKGWKAAVRNTFDAFTKSKSWADKGYNQYSKNGKAFVLPSGIGMTAEVIIPRSQTQWMLDQPDSVLSTSAAHYDVLHGDYSFGDKVLLKDPYHEHVIHKNLARNLNGMISDINEEVCQDVDDFFGSGEEWHSVTVLDVFMKLIPRITNRMLVGEPLCRNKVYLDNMLGFTMDVIRGFLIFGLTPSFLHPIIGPVAGLAPKWHAWRTWTQSAPMIKKRLADIKKKDAGDPEYKDWKEPNDFVTWTIRTAMSEGRADEYDAWRINLRLLPINFASIHTTAMTGHAALLDILSADPDVVDQLREEASRVYEEEGYKWTKPGLARMYRMDSAIRESQRFSSFALTFVHRKVLPREGVTGPDGTHYTKGTILSCPWVAVSQDEDLHQDADKYDAFRYSRTREAYEAKAAIEKDNSETLKFRQTSLVTTSDKHLPFSHGRHACPGRFFVSHELKMLFAYLILNYDIKPLKERPTSFWLARNYIPPSSATIEVKRRNSSK